MERSGRGSIRAGRTLRRGAALAAGAAATVLAAACGSDSTGPGDDDGTAQEVSLAVGESQVVRPSSTGVLRLRVPGPSSSGAEYRLAVQSAAETQGNTPMRLGVTAGGAASASSSVASAPVSTAGSHAVRGWGVQQAGGEMIRQRVRQRTVEMLRRRGVRPSDGRRSVQAQSLLPSETPAEGDTLRFWFDVQEDQRPACDTTQATKITAIVQAVGPRVAMVEDTLVDDGGGALTGGMDYQALLDEFESSVFDTDVAYFGSPTDIDGNNRVLVLFTNAVNEFSAQQTGGSGGAVVSGFFSSADLADSGDPAKDGSQTVGACESSNEAEVMWLLAPDPDGSTGEQVGVAQATQSARSTSGHEFQHMLSTANRIIKSGGDFGDVEATWLDEGLSHLAEEVIGLQESGVGVRQNLTLSDVTGSTQQDSVFNTFLAANFNNLLRHLQDPPATLALVAGADPGDPETFPMRGNAWLFVRWLADQFGPASGGDGLPGAGEDLLIEQLAGADGSLETGIANVEAATGSQWADLVADYGAAVSVDDAAPEVASRQQVLTWDLPGLYESSNIGQYPLSFTSLGFQAASFDFTVQGGTGRYFYLTSSGSASDVVLEVTDQTGQPLSTGSPQVSIVRIQ